MFFSKLQFFNSFATPLTLEVGFSFCFLFGQRRISPARSPSARCDSAAPFTTLASAGQTVLFLSICYDHILFPFPFSGGWAAAPAAVSSRDAAGARSLESDFPLSLYPLCPPVSVDVSMVLHADAPDEQWYAFFAGVGFSKYSSVVLCRF